MDDPLVTPTAATAFLALYAMLILLTITSRKKQTTATTILFGIISNPEGIIS